MGSWDVDGVRSWGVLVSSFDQAEVGFDRIEHCVLGAGLFG